MNIRKWVDFVLNPVLTNAPQTGLCIHSITCDPSVFSEEFLADPIKAEKRMMEVLNQSGTMCKQVKVDFFQPQPVINIFQESIDHELPLNQSTPDTLRLLGEVQYQRMRQYGIYKFGCLIEYETTYGDDKRGLEDIVSDIRAIPTVTIVSVVLANEKISTGRYVAGLQIKFIPSFPGSLTQPEEAKAYILTMIKKLKNVRGISRVTLKTDRIE